MIFKGDDTNAFNNKFLTIDLEGVEGVKISKAEFKCGSICKTFENPTFPLEVNFTCDETKTLLANNCCHLAVYDEFGRKRTCQGEITFVAKEQVV